MGPFERLDQFQVGRQVGGAERISLVEEGSGRGDRGQCEVERNKMPLMMLRERAMAGTL